jgi:hypothetical protein
MKKITKPHSNNNKKAPKRIRMKTKIPNKSYFLLKGKIENKNEFNKRTLKKVKQSKE